MPLRCLLIELHISSLHTLHRDHTHLAADDGVPSTLVIKEGKVMIEGRPLFARLRRGVLVNVVES